MCTISPQWEHVWQAVCQTATRLNESMTVSDVKGIAALASMFLIVAIYVIESLSARRVKCHCGVTGATTTHGTIPGGDEDDEGRNREPLGTTYHNTRRSSRLTRTDAKKNKTV